MKSIEKTKLKQMPQNTTIKFFQNIGNVLLAAYTTDTILHDLCTAELPHICSASPATGGYERLWQLRVFFRLKPVLYP